MDRLCTTRAARTRETRTRSVRWLAFFCVAVLLLGACANNSTSDRLVTLSAIEVDPESGLLSVQGSGLPPARPCELEARGKLFVAGQAVEDAHHVLSCRSVSEQALSANLETWRADLNGSALFEGELTVTFADDDGAPRLRGVLPSCRIRIQGHGASEPQRVLAEAHEARAYQRALGIAELEAQPRGLRISALASDGRAARAGLRVGDIVTRIDGAPVELVSDLRGRPEAHSAELGFLRDGVAQRLQLVLREAASSGDPLARQLLFALGVIGGLLWPMRQMSGRRSQVGLRRVLLGATLLGTLSVLLLGSLDVRALWIAPALVQLAVVGMAWRRRSLSSHESLLALIDLGSASLAVSALGVLGGSLELPWGSDGPLAPWTFALLATPGGWLAGLVLLQPAQPVPGANAYVAFFHRASKLATLVAFASAPANLHGAGLMLVLAALLLTLTPPKLSRRTCVGLAVCALPLALVSSFPSVQSVGPLCGAALCGVLLTRVLRTLATRGVTAEHTLDPQLLPFV
ncbi:MAG: PDZ domain-containing protein [Myxococcales bacterium]